MDNVGQSTQFSMIPRWMMWLIAIIIIGMNPDAVASSTPKFSAAYTYNATDNADLEYSYTSGTHRLNEVIDWYNQEIYEFTYDGNGNVNRLSSVLGSSDYQITSTSYDWRNLPLSMVVSGAGTHTYRKLT